jgi:hypothetical protein
MSGLAEEVRSTIANAAATLFRRNRPIDSQARRVAAMFPWISETQVQLYQPIILPSGATRHSGTECCRRGDHRASKPAGRQAARHSGGDAGGV